MKYENFNEFFKNINTDNNQFLSRWEEIKNKKKKTNIIAFVLILIIDIIVISKIQISSIFSIMPILSIDIFIIIFIQIISGGKDVREFNKDYKEIIINKMLENFIEELNYSPLKSMPSNIYDEVGYGGHYNKYYSDDYFEGKINGQKIIMSDLLVQEETTHTDADGNVTTETTTIFNGLFGKISLDKSINCNLNITRAHRFSLFSNKKLEMDSYEFEKVFNVYTDNNIIAMQLLTVDIQEDILTLYNKYKINFHIVIMQNKMYVLFNTGRMFEVFSTKNNPNQVLEKYFEIIKFIYKIVNKILTTIDDTQI